MYVCILKVAKYMTNSLASYEVNNSQLSACPGKMEPFKDHMYIWALPDIWSWQASETNHSKSSLGNFQHHYLYELMVNVYSY